MIGHSARPKRDWDSDPCVEITALGPGYPENAGAKPSKRWPVSLNILLIFRRLATSRATKISDIHVSCRLHKMLIDGNIAVPVDV